MWHKQKVLNMRTKNCYNNMCICTNECTLWNRSKAKKTVKKRKYAISNMLEPRLSNYAKYDNVDVKSTSNLGSYYYYNETIIVLKFCIWVFVYMNIFTLTNNFLVKFYSIDSLY